MNRKRLSLVAAGALALSSLTIAFSGAAHVRAQGTTLELWHGWQGAYADAITKIFDDYNSSNKDGITVNLTNPGDLILSGTPANSRPVEPGDVVTVEVDGLGMLESHIVEGVNPVSLECGWPPSASEKVLGVALGEQLRE